MKKSLQVILLLILIQAIICAVALTFLFSNDGGPTIGGLGLVETFTIAVLGSVLISIAIFSSHKVPREDLAFGTFLSVLFWLFVVPYVYVKLSEMENEKYQKKMKEEFKKESLTAPK